ncbi:hypothetical protein ACFV0T_11330 [Streptomyces sp. NPDC059582]|uniref:hypothetical protein n=1 Tax=Streptomyces sp. NPDC059582 TaxID=3346875 RepID=UPI0036A45351
MQRYRRAEHTQREWLNGVTEPSTQYRTARAPDLIAWRKEEMAGYKYPRLIEFLDLLPADATGKILTRELRSALGA